MWRLRYRRDGTTYPEGEEGLKEWINDAQNLDKKRVADTLLANGIRVSTVWLSLDHGIREDRPLIFETMVFPSKGSFEELDCRRYSTEAAALEGHKELCNKYGN